jgi:ParB/RepB/Spo0J family partition protein
MKLVTVPVREIRPNPFQPRQRFEEESLKELANSLRSTEIIQPIIVRRIQKGYQIIAGERRWRAAQIAGLKEVPCIVRESPEEKILLESLVENLHRKDLTDIERENAIHELWKNRKPLGFETKPELASAIGIPVQNVENDIAAWEFRRKEGGIPPSTPTYIITRTEGLPVKERKKIIEKVQTGKLQAQEAYTAIKVLRKASEPVKQDLLKPKPVLTPRMAETIVEEVPDEKQQRHILEQVKLKRLTEDEVQDWVSEIRRARETGGFPRKEMGVKEGTTYTVGEYECTHCKKHYLIKCNGKQDWLE